MAPSYGGQDVQNGNGQYGYSQGGYGSPNGLGGPATQAYQPQQQAIPQPTGLPANGRVSDAGNVGATARPVPPSAAQRQASPRPTVGAPKSKPKEELIAVQPHTPEGSELDALWKARTVPLYAVAKQRPAQPAPASVLGPKLW
jgi:hypothetical protein